MKSGGNFVATKLPLVLPRPFVQLIMDPMLSEIPSLKSRKLG